MTSMFWTASSARVAISSCPETETADRGPPFPGFGALSLHGIVGAIARRDALLLRVLRRVGLDLLAHQLAVGLHPVADGLPLIAVPLLEFRQARAFMIQARHLERRHQADRAQLLQTLVVDVQVLD